MNCIAAIFLAFAVGNQLTAKELKISRDNAINKIQSGQKKTGLMQLKNLADDGDFKSSYLLGLYYLKSPHIVRTDLDISFHYLKQSGKSCYPQALNALETFFLNNSQSKYFAPKNNKAIERILLNPKQT